MTGALASELTQLGLTPTEAQVYVALLQNGALGASAIAAATGLARTSVYPAVGALVDKGLVDGGEGYGSRFSAIPADRALPHLMEHDKEALLQRERLTHKLIEHIASLEEREDAAPEEVIQVIRSPRAVAERFARLQLEAERQIDVFTKPPYFTSTENHEMRRALRRRVRARGLYEKAALEHPAIKPFLAGWIDAGEEIRIYDGELPHKLAIFDSQVVLMPLIGPGEQTKTLLIRHPQLAQSLSLAFEYIWERSEPPVQAAKAKTTKAGKGVPNKPKASRPFGSNHHRSRSSLTRKQETA